MKTLTLLRHAKAEEGSPGQDDHDRALRPRGHRAAVLVGIETVGSVPDLVLCSTARRTRETLAGLVESWGQAPSVLYERELYLATPETLLKQLTRLATDTRSVWLIGHNPGLHELAVSLLGNTIGDAALHMRFPTAARAVFTLQSWHEPGSARFAAFVIPGGE
jgi:phosphohistidine phosphatase